MINNGISNVINNLKKLKEYVNDSMALPTNQEKIAEILYVFFKFIIIYQPVLLSLFDNKLFNIIFKIELKFN